MSVNEETIRKLVNQIWESEGRPNGQADRHWQQALTLAEGTNHAKEVGRQRSIDPSEAKGPIEPTQPDQT